MLCVASDRKVCSQVNGRPQHGFHCLVYKVGCGSQQWNSQGDIFCMFYHCLSVYPYTQNPFQIWSKRCRSVAQLNTAYTHTRTHTESQKFWVHKRTATQLSWKHKWLIQVRALLNRLQGQCPHVDSQASTLWPKQLHPLIHLHETWRTQGVFFLRETLTSRVHSGIVLSPRND